MLFLVSCICKDSWNILNEDKRDNQTGYYGLKKMLPGLKRECERMNQPSSQVLQDVVKSLNASCGC